MKWKWNENRNEKKNKNKLSPLSLTLTCIALRRGFGRKTLKVYYGKLGICGVWNRV